MILISFAFAWWAFLLTFNLSKHIWLGLASGAATFAAMALMIKFDLDIPLYITIGILALITIAVYIKQWIT